MTQSATFKLSMPPSSNQAYTNIPGRGRIVSDKLRRWRTAAGWELELQKSKGLKPFDEPVTVDIKLQELSARVQDADNRQKHLLDLLVKHGVLKDDSSKYVRKVSVEWVRPGTGPACTVTVSEAEDIS